MPIASFDDIVGVDGGADQAPRVASFADILSIEPPSTAPRVASFGDILSIEAPAAAPRRKRRFDELPTSAEQAIVDTSAPALSRQPPALPPTQPVVEPQTIEPPQTHFGRAAEALGVVPPGRLGSAKTGGAASALSGTMPVLDAPAEGVGQIVRGVQALRAAATAPEVPTAAPAQVIAPRPPSARVAPPAPVIRPLAPETMNAASDVVEGTFKALEPLIVSGAITHPLATAVTLAVASEGAHVAQDVALQYGASPAAARLVGNAVATVAGGVAGAATVPEIPDWLKGQARAETPIAVPPPEGVAAPAAAEGAAVRPVKAPPAAALPPELVAVGGESAFNAGRTPPPKPEPGVAHISEIVSIEPPKEVLSAPQEQSPAAVDVRQQTRDGETVGGGDAEPRGTARASDIVEVLPPAEAAPRGPAEEAPPVTPGVAHVNDIVDVLPGGGEQRRLPGDVGQVREPRPLPNDPNPIRVERFTNLPGEQGALQERAAAAVEATPTLYVDRYRKKFGNVVSADNAKELFPEYAATPEARTQHDAAVHRPASAVAQAVYDRLLEEPPPPGHTNTTVLLAGGTGSGKSSTLETFLPELRDRAHVVYDSTLTDVHAAVRNIEHARRVGDDVVVAFTDRAVEDAFRATLQRASVEGRPVTLQTHLSTHLKAPEVFQQLQERYAQDPHVDFFVVANSAAGRDLVPLADWTPRRYNRGDVQAHLERILAEEHAARRVTDTLQAAVSQSDRSRAADTRGVGEGEPGAPSGRPVEDTRGTREVTPSTAHVDDIVSIEPPASPRKPSVSDLGKPHLERGTTLESTLLPGARQFAEQDLAPAAGSAVKTLARAGDDIQKAFAPQTRGNEATRTGQILRANLGEFARRTAQVSHSLETARGALDRRSRTERLQFIDDIEHGRQSADAVLEPVQRALRQILDDRRRQVQEHGRLDDFIQNYFPHIWKDPAAATTWVRGLMRRPLEGPKSFLKQRSIPTTADGIARGLEPISDNPVDLTLLKVREMDKWLMGRSVLAEMKEQGTAKFVSNRKTAPAGWVPVEDPIGTIYGRSDKGELVVRGRYYAPREAADLLNNHLRPGLRGKPIYDAYMWIGNGLNQLQLGLSGFHAATSAVNAVASKQALALEALSRGEIKAGLRALVQSPFAPIADARKGGKLLEAYRSDVPGDPELAAIVEHVVQAGGRASIDPIYKNDAWKGFLTALRGGNYPGAALRVIPAAIEAAAKPVMEVYVPRLKLAAFADLARLEARRLGPDAGVPEVRAAMQRAWDSVDNRFGQVVYDNLFLNRVLKDVLHASVRSVGWNLGTLRELGGGVYDATLPQFRRHAGDGPGERAEPRLTHRMAFLMAMSTTTGLMAATYQYLHTGQLPDGPRDLVFPRTGAKNQDGTEERVSMPGYLKDAYALSTKPIQTAEHKLHPFLSLLAQTAENADYYGVEIRHKDDPAMQQLRDYVGFLFHEMTPISLQNARKRRDTGAGLKGQFESQIGISPAPRAVVSPPTDAEELAREYLGPPDVRTKEQEAKRQERGRYREAVRTGDVATAQEVVKAGKLSESTLREVTSTAQLTRLQNDFRRLTLEQAFRVYEVATPAERDDLIPLLETKAQNADVAPADVERLRAKVETVKALPRGKKTSPAPAAPRPQASNKAAPFPAARPR